MQETIKLFCQALQAETAGGKYVGLFLIALFYLWFFHNKKQPLTLFAIVCSILVFNPLIFWGFLKVFPALGDYNKLIWTIPIPLVLAYAAVEIFFQVKSKKGVAILSFILIIAVSGTVLPYKADLLKRKYQKEYLENAINAVIEQEEYYNQKIVLLAPDDMMATARSYSENIYPLYGKDLWMKEANAEVADDYKPEIYQLYEKMKVDYTCPNEIAVFAEKYDCNVLVLREKITKDLGKMFDNWELTEEIPGYLIYRYLSK